MKKMSTVARYLLGLIYLASGVVGFFNLVPPPPDMPAAMAQFFQGMMAAKYFFPLLKLTEMICGLFLLIPVAPALMLMILAPVTINIFFVHAFVTPGIENLLIPIVLLALHGFAAVNYWKVLRPLLDKNKT